MQKNNSQDLRKELKGVVISDKMNKTIVVKTTHRTLHPVFKKYVVRFSKFKAHDEKNSAKTGDTVRIKETRPLSKDKRWRLIEIVRKSA